MTRDIVDHTDKVGSVSINEMADGGGVYLEIEGQGELGVMIGPDTVKEIDRILREESYKMYVLERKRADDLRSGGSRQVCGICKEDINKGVHVDPLNRSTFHKGCLRMGIDRCLKLMNRNTEHIVAVEL